MSSIEENTGKLLRRLPKVDAPVGLEQRLRKRIAAGEGRGMQPLAMNRSTSAFIPYSIAASVLIVALAGYVGTRMMMHDTAPPAPAQSAQTAQTPVATSPSSNQQQSQNAAAPMSAMRQAGSSVDRATGNSHRDVATTKEVLGPGTPLEQLVARPTPLSARQQALASQASQSNLPEFSTPVKVLNRTSPALVGKGDSASLLRQKDSASSHRSKGARKP